jgi:hypothetical protein
MIRKSSSSLAGANPVLHCLAKKTQVEMAGGRGLAGAQSTKQTRQEGKVPV